MRCKAFDLALKTAGFRRHRETRGERRWYYSLDLRLVLPPPSAKREPVRIAA
jgi:hypothetical protein